MKTYNCTYIIDRYTGRTITIDDCTGEVYDNEMVNITVPRGTIVYTPEQQSQYKERKDREEKAYLRRSSGKNFILVNSEHDYKDIKPETVGRLMYLSTFINYDSGELYKSRKGSIAKSELPKVLRLPRTTFLKFWEDVNKKYITESKTGKLRMSKEFFIRGVLPQSMRGKEWQKIYIDSIKNLYMTFPRTSHRYLGYVFQMIPFINTEYNILCHNPEESNLEKIRAITLNEFCTMSRYSLNQRKRLERKYSQIVFDVSERKERFCSFVTDSANGGEVKIYVNPNVVYKGTKLDEVKVLGEFCKS